MKPLALLSLLLALVSCSAQHLREMPESPQKDQVSKIEEDLTSETGVYRMREDIERRELSNGLEIYAIPKPDIPMVTVLIGVRNGAFVETPDMDGLAHLYEHMFFKANEKIPSQAEFIRALENMGVELGGLMNAYTSTESVRYFFTIQSRFLEKGLHFMSDALMTPKFVQEELDREKDVIIAEFDRFEASPLQVFFQHDVLKKLFSKYFSRKNVIGSREVILNTTPEQLREIQKTFYIPNNSALFIVGNYDEEVLWPSIEEAFGQWDKGTDPFEKNPVPEHPALENTIRFDKNAPVQNVNVVRAYQGPSLGKNDEETILFDLMSSILSMESSEFQRRLVHSGLASAANFFSWSQQHTSPLIFFIETTPEKAKEAAATLDELIHELHQGKLLTERQLEVAKTSTEVSTAFERESGQHYALSLADVWSSTGSLEYYLRYIEKVRQLEMKDFHQGVQKYFEGTHYVEGALLPEGHQLFDEGEQKE